MPKAKTSSAATLHKEYEPVEQLPFYCLPATLEMIFNRRGLDSGNQGYIGKLMKIRIPYGWEKVLGRVRITKSEILFGSYPYGVRYGLSSQRGGLCELFKTLGFPLTSSPHMKGHIRDPLHLQECLKQSLLLKSRDTMLSVRSDAIEGHPYRPGSHVLLLNGLEGRTVHYIDPTGGQKSTNIDRLYRAMAVHNRDGLWHIDTVKPVRGSRKALVIA